MKDNEIKKRIRFSNDDPEIAILDKLDEKYLAKIYPFLDRREGSPSNILYPFLRLSNARFEYVLNNFPDILTTKRNEEDLIVESKHWQQYTVPDFNGLINDAQKYPDKYNILMKSAAFKNYIQRLYDVWCKQDDGFIAFFELKNLPAECKSWVDISPQLTRDNLTFETIKRLMKCLDNDNCFRLFTKIDEENIPLTFTQFAELARDNTERSVDTMAVVLYKRFKDWFSGRTGASDFDRVVNLKAISIRSFARIFPVLNDKIIEWFKSAEYVFRLIADLPYEKAKFIIERYKTNIIAAIQKDNQKKYWEMLQSPAMNALFDGLSDGFDGLVNSGGIYASIHDSLNEENRKKFSERWQSNLLNLVRSLVDIENIIETLSPDAKEKFKTQLKNETRIERLQPGGLHDYAIIARYLPESVATTIYLGKVNEVFYAQKPCDRSDLSAAFGFLLQTGMLSQDILEVNAIRLDQSMLDVLLESIKANIQAIKDKKKITNLLVFCKTIFNKLGETALKKILSDNVISDYFLNDADKKELEQLGKSNNTNKTGSSTGYSASGSSGHNTRTSTGYNAGSSNASTNANFEAALKDYETARSYLARAAYPSNVNISSEQRMALVEKHVAEIFKETGISQYNQTPYSLEKFSEKVKEIFNIDLSTAESFTKFKDSPSTLLKDCVMLFRLRKQLADADVYFGNNHSDILHAIEFELFAKDTSSDRNLIGIHGLFGLEKGEENDTKKLKEGFSNKRLQFHSDNKASLSQQAKEYCDELFKFIYNTYAILSAANKKMEYASAKRSVLVTWDFVRGGQLKSSSYTR